MPVEVVLPLFGPEWNSLFGSEVFVTCPLVKSVPQPTVVRRYCFLVFLWKFCGQVRSVSPVCKDCFPRKLNNLPDVAVFPCLLPKYFFTIQFALFFLVEAAFDFLQIK